MTRLRGFIGNTYSLPDLPVEAQRTINLYTQIDESQNAQDGEIGALVSCPGLKKVATIGKGPIRGQYTLANGVLAVVSGSEVFRAVTPWNFVKAGDISTASGPVSMADNTNQLVIVDGTYGYVLSLVDGKLTRITGDWFPGANTVTFQDGYFIFNNPNTGQFFWSNLYDGLNGDALNYITAEGSPDNVMAVLSNQRQLWVPGLKTVEVFWNSGGDTTFSRIDGAFIEYGCGAAQSFRKIANTVIWLGGGTNGEGIIWMAQGYQPKRISNHAVESAIQSYGDISSSTAWVYQDGGHNFYCLNLPNAPVTWVFDIATGQWHERAYLGLDGNFQRHRAEHYAFAFDHHVVGDYQNGNIYVIDHDTRSDDGNPLKWVRRSPHLSSERKRIFYHRVELVCRTGDGADGNPPSNFVDPSVELRYSNDYGNTWSNARSKSLGTGGKYNKRVYWNQLGSSRTRTFEISGSDPVKIALLGIELNVTNGGN